MFWSTAIRLVSQAPDNLVYHLFTLLAILAASSLAFWQWRRITEDDFAWRMLIGTAGILITRLIVPLTNASTPPNLRILTVPPLERALDTAVIIFLLWVLIPPIKSLPRLSDTILLLGLLIVGIAYYFAAQDWDLKLAAGLLYGDTGQAAGWAVTQFILLMGGILLLTATRPTDWLIRLLVLLPLAVASGTHMAGIQPDVINIAAAAPDVNQGNIAVWTRLSYFITFPLLALVAQRHILISVLSNTFGSQNSEEVLQTLASAEAIMQANNKVGKMIVGAELITQLTGAPFAAVAYAGSAQNNTVPIGIFEGSEKQISKEWTIRLEDWAGIQSALQKNTWVELLPNGLGSRQIHGLQQELAIDELGPLLIVPLKSEAGTAQGVMLIGAETNQAQWPTDSHDLLATIGRFLTAALTDETRRA